MNNAVAVDAVEFHVAVGLVVVVVVGFVVAVAVVVVHVCVHSYHL